MKTTDEMDKEWAEAIKAAGAATEQEMREAKVPWPDSEEALTGYIRGLVDRPHDYGTCVYAMSMAATAAFYYVSNKLGVTGFQASCADMDILRRTRSMNDGFRIINYADMLYPQYWGDERGVIFSALMRDDDTRERVAKRASEKLDECDPDIVHPNVLSHWERLAGKVT